MNTISMVDGSIDHGELLLICFLTVFVIHFSFKCLGKFVPGEGENKFRLIGHREVCFNQITQIWVVTCHQYGISVVRCHFLGTPVVTL